MSRMKTRTFTIDFSTPAFLGNAEQSGQWRTPPFKALLRQWWRVAWAAEKEFPAGMGSVNSMRREEGVLFGAAADGTGNRSVVRMRLDRWSGGSLSQWKALPKVSHPEVRFPVDAGLYLGYGPITLPKGSKSPAIKANAAIQAGEEAGFSLAFPEQYSQNLDRALFLMDRFGALGGRSRNGWGSVGLSPSDDAEESLEKTVPLRSWQQCLDRDWPHAIGRDDRGPLIWQTRPVGDWPSLMKQLAQIKIGCRTQFKFNSGWNASHPEKRHWLSYPVTRHSVKNWGNNARLPNSLRFKVRRTPDGKLLGVIFHMPHLPPDSFRPDPKEIEALWRQAHRYLDAQKSLLIRIAQ